MTAGSWSSGSYSGADTFIYALKTWSGGNGKTEAWAGGTRLKWNNYTMTHWKIVGEHPLTVPDPFGGPPLTGLGVGEISNRSPTSLKLLCGWGVNDDLRLLAKLAENVKGHSFNLGVNIAQAKESYNTVLGNVSAIGRSLIALKRGHPGQAMRQLGLPQGKHLYRTIRSKGGLHKALEWRGSLRSKDISGRWLEMQYGWLPMVNDSFEAAKALEAVTGPRVLRFTASIASKRATYNGSGASQYTYPVVVSYGKRLKAELYEDITVNRSLGLVDPLSIAWEVVPYSFVVDWFIPVGTYLSTWSVIPALKGRFMTTERIGQKAGNFKLTGICPPGSRCAAQFGSSKSNQTWFSTTRSVSSSLSMPMPTFNSLPKALSPKRLANAVSLIHQLL